MTKTLNFRPVLCESVLFCFKDVKEGLKGSSLSSSNLSMTLSVSFLFLL